MTTWRSQEGTEPQEVTALSRGVPEAATSPAHSPSQLFEVGSWWGPDATSAPVFVPQFPLLQ